MRIGKAPDPLEMTCEFLVFEISCFASIVDFHLRYGVCMMYDDANAYESWGAHLSIKSPLSTLVFFRSRASGTHPLSHRVTGTC